MVADALDKVITQAISTSGILGDRRIDRIPRRRPLLHLAALDESGNLYKEQMRLCVRELHCANAKVRFRGLSQGPSLPEPDGALVVSPTPPAPMCRSSPEAARPHPRLILRRPRPILPPEIEKGDVMTIAVAPGCGRMRDIVGARTAVGGRGRAWPGRIATRRVPPAGRP